jgi:hypothetical protein
MGRVIVIGFAVLLAASMHCHPPVDSEARLREALPALDILHTLQPCYLSADFDGDGTPDFAIQVRDRATGKVGIAIENSSTGEWFVAGAGHRMSSAEDDFDWMDTWRVVPNSVKRKGAAIMAEKSSSASGLIYWDGHGYQWFQRGD